MARVFSGKPPRVMVALAPVERLVYRLAGIEANEEQTWKQYAGALLTFNVSGFVLLFILQ
ncbi:MAG: potassium-transporting ATPase subunit KdpA, partial [Anaerolineae bacterium]|nr:potassium-transporting ATPase subunit KdpA [Anaerolineae bacterium]